MGFLFGALTTLSFLATMYFFGFIRINFGRTPEEPEHFHDWKVRGVNRMYNERTYHGIQLQPTEDGEPYTEILWRCGCGEIETTQEDGHWTFEEVAGLEEEEPVTESLAGAALRSCAAKVAEDRAAALITKFCGFESIHEAHDYQGKHCPGSTAAGACPSCPHRAHPGVSCKESDSCGCGQ